MATSPTPDAQAAVTAAGQPDTVQAEAPLGLWGQELGSFNPWWQLCAGLAGLLPRHVLNRVRTRLYRLGGVRVGRTSLVLDRLVLSGKGAFPERLSIGENCVVNGPAFVDLSAAVTLGDRVSVGHHTIFVTADHDIGPAHFRSGPVKPRPIRIGNGCLIGARVTILPGVSIGEGAVIAPGAMVGADVPANKLAAGSPARVVKSLPEEAPR
ncbi:MAG: acyltransferase [Deltaproteobacteria bacterium]|nr:acyltransferase [Deltaproteobacteria bacterium]